MLWTRWHELRLIRLRPIDSAHSRDTLQIRHLSNGAETVKNIAIAATTCAVIGRLVSISFAAIIERQDFQAVSVSVTSANVMGKDTLQVVKAPTVKEFDEPTFAKRKGDRFKDGTIEVKVLSRLLKDAPEFSRGFIGIAFRTNDDNSQFECIYLRPQNARVDDQVRRNHSIQYFAYPEFKFQRLRKESPEAYESYSDMALNEWIDLKIEVKGAQAKLFLNGSKQPSLVVNDLKLGSETSGSVGLWVDVGTEGYFSDLRIRPE
jgi:hypothetical protein